MRTGRLSRLWPGNRDAHACLRCRTSYGPHWPYEPGHLTVAESPLLPNLVPADPLCHRCWADLAPAERLPYYQRWHLQTHGPNPRENALIYAALEYAIATGA